MILRPLKDSASSLSSYYYIDKGVVCCYAEANLKCFKGVYFHSVNILLTRQILLAQCSQTVSVDAVKPMRSLVKFFSSSINTTDYSG